MLFTQVFFNSTLSFLKTLIKDEMLGKHAMIAHTVEHVWSSICSCGWPNGVNLKLYGKRAHASRWRTRSSPGTIRKKSRGLIVCVSHQLFLLGLRDKTKNNHFYSCLHTLLFFSSDFSHHCMLLSWDCWFSYFMLDGKII